MTTKLHQQIIKRIKALAPGVGAEVIAQNRHLVVELSRPGVESRRMPIACSPKNKGFTFRQAVAQAARLLQLEKP